MTVDPVYCERRLEAVRDLTAQVKVENSLIEDGIAAVVGAAADSTVLGIIGFALNPRKALMAALLETATGFSSFALLQVIPIIKKILGLFERFNFERRSVKRRLQTCRDRMGDVDMALERARHVTVETMTAAQEARRLAASADATGNTAK